MTVINRYDGPLWRSLRGTNHAGLGIMVRLPVGALRPSGSRELAIRGRNTLVF